MKYWITRIFIGFYFALYCLIISPVFAIDFIANIIVAISSKVIARYDDFMGAEWIKQIIRNHKIDSDKRRAAKKKKS